MMRTKEPLKEFVCVAQRPEGFRRLFTNNCFDLWLWYDYSKTKLTGFQLVWNHGESAITWTPNSGMNVNRIMTGDWPDCGTPILDGAGDVKKIHPLLIAIFKSMSEKLDQSIVYLVTSMIMKYSGVTQEMVDAEERSHPDLPQYLIER
jgi:hypothetical protein